MKCNVCGHAIDGQYFTDKNSNAFCSEKCFNTTLPQCCVCSVNMKQWTEDKSGKKYCSDKCFQTTLPKCYSCNKPMTKWTENEKGQKFCSETCYSTSLPKCAVCGINMKQWTEDKTGKKYCSDACYSTSLPKCNICGTHMKKWTEDKAGRKYCSEKCYHSTLPKCHSCKKNMKEWIIVDENNYCNLDCLSTTYKYYRVNDVEKKMKRLGYDTLDVLITGSTGVGKSSTLNCLFDKTVAKVGHGVDPETMNITNYSRGNRLQIWDTPGFGDGIDRDKDHSKKIINLLNTRIAGDDRYAFIDMVVVLLEASLRDMGTAYQLINEVIIPNLKDGKRVVIGINQADFAMKGKNFDYEKNMPNPELEFYLEEKVSSIRKRISESTGLSNVSVIYYSAETGYNITRLLDSIIDNIPDSKRALY